MNETNLYWMNYSINLAKAASNQNLHVGAILVSGTNELICSAFTDEKKRFILAFIVIIKN